MLCNFVFTRKMNEHLLRLLYCRHKLLCLFQPNLCPTPRCVHVLLRLTHPMCTWIGATAIQLGREFVLLATRTVLCYRVTFNLMLCSREKQASVTESGINLRADSLTTALLQLSTSGCQVD